MARSSRPPASIAPANLHTAGAHRRKQIFGTPAQIVDHLEEWFTQDAADGFNVIPPHLPGGLAEFVELVIPELQRRGLFRTEYEGTTLRENLVLSRPANRVASAALVIATAAEWPTLGKACPGSASDSGASGSLVRGDAQ